MAVVHGGRHAVTLYWALDRSASPLPATLVSCRLQTGRTHQVRVHFAAIGHPVVGDERYCKAAQLSASRALLPSLGRPCLHAAQLGFSHPVTGERLSFTSPLPSDLLAALAALGLAPGASDLGNAPPGAEKA
jgi:23S rRNA pseudouridine1911/1915/1917 synthase